MLLLYILFLANFLQLPMQIHMNPVIPMDHLDLIRTNMMVTEERMMEGGRQVLSDKERIVNDIIQGLKREEIIRGAKDLVNYAPALHFFHGKPLLEQSKVFNFIKQIPKGAVLHVHNTAAVSSDWVIQNLTNRPEAEYCMDKDGLVILTAGFHENCVDKPVNLMHERRNLTDDQKRDFDAWLLSSISLVTDEPEQEYSDVNVVWAKFDGLFNVMKGLITYLPFFKDFHYRMLEEYYNDGIFYTEIRTSFPELYDAAGNKYDTFQSAGVLLDVAQEFAKTHPYFIGMKAIYAVFRRSSETSLEKRLKTFHALKMKFPAFVIGFDFVGQEDLGMPLVSMKHAMDSLPPETNLFFHAGETNWWGTATDFNIIDAILFNTTRIGHGYALLKHPIMWNAVLTKNIAIEVSVLSNQILHLVQDLRNHPAAIYLALNIPIVITNDDPTFWGAEALSHDWYYAFMALAPANSGLKLLKQLALNSIKYSILTWEERHKFDYIFKKAWDEFLNKIISKHALH